MSHNKVVANLRPFHVVLNTKDITARQDRKLKSLGQISCNNLLDYHNCDAPVKALASNPLGNMKHHAQYMFSQGEISQQETRKGYRLAEWLSWWFRPGMGDLIVERREFGKPDSKLTRV